MAAADRRMAARRSSPCKLLIIVLHANREHRRDAYATIGSATCLTPGPPTVHVVRHSTQLLSRTLSLVDFFGFLLADRPGDTSRSALKSVLEMSKLQGTKCLGQRHPKERSRRVRCDSCRRAHRFDDWSDEISLASRVLEFLSSSTPISLLLQRPLTSLCGGDLPQGFGTATVTPRRLYPSVGALAPLRKVSSRFQNPAQNISVTRPHIDREPRAQLYQAVP